MIFISPRKVQNSFVPKKPFGVLYIVGGGKGALKSQMAGAIEGGFVVVAKYVARYFHFPIVLSI